MYSFISFFFIEDMSLSLNVLSPAENSIHVHDLLTFQQITGLPKAKGATLFACDLQVSSRIVAVNSAMYCSEYICYLISVVADRPFQQCVSGHIFLKTEALRFVRLTFLFLPSKPVKERKD